MAFALGEASSSSALTGSTPCSCTYHVFLSFRGEDTRKGFTDDLYAALERKGIRTYRDDKDLDRGEVISLELLKAIEESMFAIAVLSPNYASSTWCLDELQKIVECNHNLGLSVVPVFYGVEPSDVRHQKGSFEKAFRKHEERFGQDGDKVKKWRDALRQVASYSGWSSKGEYETALVESISQHIHKRLIPKLPSWATNLVGIASRVKKVSRLIAIGLHDVRFIGIWGIGGIGKTTITRALYEAMQGEFEDSFFIGNVREVFETNGLVHIQRELVSHLNMGSPSFYNINIGKEPIRNSLCNKKVLLVLDDVSEVSQLENLIGKQWFGPGSRIIITTRCLDLLRIYGVHEAFEVGGLLQNEALELFYSKAFKRDQPHEYLDLSKEIVKYTRGLPLAIEVLGSYLYGREVDVWHSALKRIRSFPLPKVQDALRISYDGLHPMEKQLFLDIACFFKGMNINKAMDILENCGHSSRKEIEVLIEKSLVTLGRWSKNLEMHDLVQEMGRNIVVQESPNDPGRRSRLWSQEEINHVLTNNKGTEAIRGIVLNSLEPYEAHWSIEAFFKTSQLKFLSLCDMQLPFGLSCLPTSLKVLHWKGCPLKTLPLTDQLDRVDVIRLNCRKFKQLRHEKKFLELLKHMKLKILAPTNQLDQVVDIKLCHSKIKQLWKGKKFLTQMKHMELSFSENIKRLPDFSGLPNLETFVAEGCTKLIKVHPTLLQHKKVVLMNLKDCKSLKALPSTLEMSSLKELILCGCSKLKYLPQFGQSMKHLSLLSLEGTAIRALPKSLGSLVGLHALNLKDCKCLVWIPDTIRGLKCLRDLNVSGCIKLPNGLREMKLEELFASGTCIEVCQLSLARWRSVKSCLPNLLYGSASVPTPFGFGFQPSILSLSSMDLSYCNLSEQSFPHDFCHLTSLEFLNLSGNSFVKAPASIPKLSKLEILKLNHCQKLQMLPDLPTSIRELDASNCDSLQTSEFNPCILLASLTKYPPKELLLSHARFDMVIPRCEIPSWFIHKKEGRYVSVRHNECVAIALCFLIVSYAEPCEESYYSVKCSMTGRNADAYNSSYTISERVLPPMKPDCPHLYILFLTDQFSDGVHQYSHFGLTSTCRFSKQVDLKIVRCGGRLVSQQDV